ncbi:recombinase family protein [Fictibacillus sp. KU28468]|uniref:recombinase family protein n=1 Tax=Fictibacillus sp. KU28468 TaxID=2991053 RepID=UPI00223D86A1|nr:recombinase family protein [Fictibacillus sp. KU28468]UZJ80551.1 recombinase family protein [Fictibacillus sp. KU28468]
MTTVAYYRSSTDMQENSVDTQRHQAEMCAAKNSLVIDKEYIDKGVSARKVPLHQRKSMNELLYDIKKGKIKNLIVYKRDRLARNVEESMNIFNEIKANGVKIYYAASNEFEMRCDPVGEFYELIMAAYSEREGETIIKRIMETKQALVKEGLIPNGRPCIGYKKTSEPGKWEEKTSEMDIIKKVIEEFMKDENKFSTLSAFVLHLINNDFKPVGKGGWTSQKVEAILTNPVYMGKHTITILNETLPLDVSYLAIMSEKEWSEIQQKLAETKRKKAKSASVDPELHLKELLKCSFCKGPLKIIRKKLKKKDVLFYTCKNHPETKFDLERLHKIALNRTEIFFRRLHSISFKDVFMTLQKHQTDNLNKVIEDVENQIVMYKNELHQHTEVWLLDITNEDVKQQMMKSYQNIEILELGLESFKDEKIHHREFLKRLNEIKTKVASKIDLNSYEPKGLKDIFEKFISKIKMDNNNIHFYFNHPYYEKGKWCDHVGIK